MSPVPAKHMFPIVICLCLVAACSKPNPTESDTDPQPTAVPTTGSVTFKVNNIARSYTITRGGQYLPATGNGTVIFAWNAADTNESLIIYTNLTAPGTVSQFGYNAENASVTMSRSEDGSPAYGYYSAQTPDGYSAVTITAYGAVGQRIQGTFSGKCIASLVGASGPYGVTATVTDGVFNVVREADQ